MFLQMTTSNVHTTTNAMAANMTAEMMIVINQIINFHVGLEKGESIKVITTLDNYTTYINRTDLIKKVNDDVLCVFRANDAKVAINTNYIVSCCVVRRL